MPFDEVRVGSGICRRPLPSAPIPRRRILLVIEVPGVSLACVRSLTTRVSPRLVLSASTLTLVTSSWSARNGRCPPSSSRSVIRQCALDCIFLQSLRVRAASPSQPYTRCAGLFLVYCLPPKVKSPSIRGSAAGIMVLGHCSRARANGLLLSLSLSGCSFFTSFHLW